MYLLKEIVLQKLKKYSIDYTYGSTDSGLDVSIINKTSGAGYIGQYMYIILN